MSGQFGHQRGHRGGGQPLLGAAALARSRVSDPIADVPARSTEPAADRSPITWVSTAWSMRSPDRSVCRTVGPIA